MAEINAVREVTRYIIRVDESELRTILAALAVALHDCPDMYRGYDYASLRENLLRGTK